MGDEQRDWPAGFWWGTAASSTQCEGAAPASDWLQWELDGHAPRSGDGNGFARRHAEDFALLAGLGLRHHRLSLEWARLEPQEGQHDQAAVEHYRAVLQAALDAGIEPWVCLHHFTLPRWFADDGGFLVPANRTDRWARHVDFVADTFGDLVAGWQPVNEVNFYPTAAYLGRGFAPGHDDGAEWAMASEQVQLANAEAAIRLRSGGAPVASIFGLMPLVPYDDTPETTAFSAVFDVANWTAGLGLFRDGVLRTVGRDDVVRADLAGAFDVIGFSYYCALGVHEGRMVPYPTDRPMSPLGYAIWPDGLRLVLDRLHAEVPGTPLLVGEYGIGTDDDAERAAYLSAGLDITHQAISDGIDVRGFFHWTAVDNYEWLHGDTVSFGIIDRDRVVRPSAAVLAREAGGSVTRP